MKEAKINEQYLYQDEDINSLVEIYKKDHSSNQQVSWMSACDESRIEALAIPEAVAKLKPKEKLLIPFNTGGHWVGVQIEKTEDNKANFTVLNSLNGDIKKPSASDTHWHQRWQDKLPGIELKLKMPEAQVWQQQDATTCGAWAVENLRREGYRENLGSAQTAQMDDVAVRKHHAALLEDQYFIGKQSTNQEAQSLAEQHRHNLQVLNLIDEHGTQEFKKELSDALKRSSNDEERTAVIFNLAENKPDKLQAGLVSLALNPNVNWKDLTDQLDVVKVPQHIPEFSSKFIQQAPVLERPLKTLAIKAAPPLSSSAGTHSVSEKQLIPRAAVKQRPEFVSRAESDKALTPELSQKASVDDAMEAPTKLLALHIGKLASPELISAISTWVETSKALPQEKESLWQQMQSNLTKQDAELVKRMNSEGFNHYNPESVEKLLKYTQSYSQIPDERKKSIANIMEVIKSQGKRIENFIKPKTIEETKTVSSPKGIISVSRSVEIDRGRSSQ